MDIKYCEPCLKTDLKKKSVVLCFECQVYYCSACEKDHLKFKSTSKHNLHKLEDGEQDKYVVETNEILKSTVACPGHSSETIEYCCKDHDKFCCIKCAFAYHRKCEDVVALTDLVHRTNIDSTESSEIGSRIERLETIFERLCDKENAQREKVLHSCEDVEHHVTSLKEKVYQACKEVESKILAKKVEIIRSLLEKNENQEVRIREEQFKVRELKKRHDIINMYGNPIHAYVASKEHGIKLGRREAALNKIGREHVSSKLTVKDKIPIGNIVKYIEDALEVSDVAQETLASSTVEQDAGLSALSSPRDFQERIPTLVYSVDLERDSNIRTYVWLGKYVVAALGRKSKLILIDTDSRTVCDTFITSSYPSSVCLSPNINIYVSLPKESKILIVEVKASKLYLVKSFTTQNKIHNIAYNQKLNKTYALSRDQRTIETLDMETGQSVKIQACASEEFLSCGFISCAPKCGTLFLSNGNYHDDKVIAIDANGKSVFKYNSKGLTNPCYITIDNDSNIYIADWVSAGFHQLNKSGEFIRKILTDIKKPKCMCFNDNMTQIAVIEDCKPPMLQVYDFI